jgi:hypothetical protein
MKKCAFLASLAGLLCLLTPHAALAGAPQYRQAHRDEHAALRKAPKAPRRDQVHRGNLDGTLTLIQFITNRRSNEAPHRQQAALPHSAAQVRASWEDAERESPAASTVRSVESLPPHRGAIHLCI